MSSAQHPAVQSPFTPAEADRLDAWVLVWNGAQYVAQSTTGGLIFDSLADARRQTLPGTQFLVVGGPDNTWL